MNPNLALVVTDALSWPSKSPKPTTCNIAGSSAEDRAGQQAMGCRQLAPQRGRRPHEILSAGDIVTRWPGLDGLDLSGAMGRPGRGSANRSDRETFERFA
jgi:hypothetical protein